MVGSVRLVVFGIVAVVAVAGKLAMSGIVLAQFQDTSPRHITLAWDANTEPNLDGYEVQYGTNPNAPNMVLDVQLKTTAVVPLPDLDKTYFFIVRAYDKNHVLSAPSNLVSVAGTGPSLHAPAPPRAVIITTH